MKRKSSDGGIVVFASGRGTNFRAICAAAKSGALPARVSALVSNVRGSGARDIAREFGVPAIEAPHEGHTRSSHEAAVLKALEGVSFEWIVLAGYMRLMTPEFVGRFWDAKLGAARIVNIHPSLLPAFPGKDGYAQALRYGVRVTGVTVHLVGAGLDDGPVVAQATLDVRDGDTEASLSERGLRLEHELYPATLARLLAEPWRLSTGSVGAGRPRVVFGGAGGGG